MTEDLKKFLELVSENEELQNKLNNASKDKLIAIAKENGITLTDADFEAQTGELSDDELDTVAGGKMCVCSLAGGGTGNSTGSKTCACVTGGAGLWTTGVARCICVAAGYGK